MKRQYVAIDLHRRRSLIVRDNEHGEELVLGAAVLITIIGLQIWRITQSAHPGIRAVEPLAFTIPVVVFLFATRSVRKVEPHLNPPARTRGSVRPDGRVDVSVSDCAGDAGADCQKWA